MEHFKSHSDHKILQAASQLRTPQGITKEVAWQQLEARLKVEKGKLMLLYGVTLKWAASISIILLCALGMIHFGFQENISVLAGSSKLVTLPDNSTVMLNASSAFSFHPIWWHFSRGVKLEGEGFFSVKKGSRFQVLTSTGKVEVLGTSFNVKDRNNQLEVACATGKVKVSNGLVSEILLPGDYVKTADNKIKSIQKRGIKNIGAWQNGTCHFINEPLARVFEELERQYAIQVHGEIGKDLYYTGFFQTDNLQEALQLVCIPMQLNYSIEQNQIKIKKLK